MEAVVEGCTVLETFDVSQCKNLAPWLRAGGIEKCRETYGRSVRFETLKEDSETHLR